MTVLAVQSFWGYVIAAYAVVFGVIGLYAARTITRGRKLGGAPARRPTTLDRQRTEAMSGSSPTDPPVQESDILSADDYELDLTPVPPTRPTAHAGPVRRTAAGERSSCWCWWPWPPGSS